MHTPELKNHYQKNVVPALTKAMGYGNVHQVPKILKVVVNSGVSAQLDKSAVEEVVKVITQITGQKAVTTTARKSVSNFKLREGMPIGGKVTLRGPVMWEFLYRLIAVALPNIRDFRGVPTRMDGQGNYTLGIADCTIFPEINVESNKRTIGFDISIVTSAETDAEALELLKLLGMPFRKRESAVTSEQPTAAQN